MTRQLLTPEEALRARDLLLDRHHSSERVKFMSAVLTKANRGEGTFTAYASTFDATPDLAGDVVDPGAFDVSIQNWRARKAWPPLLWQHDTDTPSAALGVITDMRVDKRGLLVTGRLDLDHEPAEAVWRAMKSGRITTFSFAFAIIRQHKRKDGVNVLDVLEVLDITITPNPANLNARLVSVKAREIEPALNDPRRYDKILDGLEGRAKSVASAVDVDAWLAEDAALRAAEAAERERAALFDIEMTERAKVLADITLEDEEAREAEARKRFEQELAWRDFTRQQEAAERERADAARRQNALDDPRICAQ